MLRIPALLLLAVVSQPFAETPDEILQRSSQVVHAGVCSLNFSVKVHYEVTGEDQQYEGDLLLGRGDRFRLRTPQAQYQSDGANLWQYNVQHKQVLIKSLLDLEGGLHPSEILFRYLRCKPLSAQKESVDGRQTWHLKLDPAGQLKMYKTMEVWLDAGSFVPIRIRTMDINGNESWYQVSGFKQMASVSDQEFVFHAPEGVEEIDMR